MIDAKEAYELSKQAKDNVCKEIEKAIEKRAKEGYTSCSYIIENDFRSEDRVTKMEELLASKGYRHNRKKGVFFDVLEIYWGIEDE